MTVGLCHAQVNRQVPAACKTYRVVKSYMAAPVGFRQPVNAQLPAKAATVECDGVVSERGKIHRPRHNIGLDTERASVCLVEPKINACQIACCDRAPGQRRPCHDL